MHTLCRRGSQHCRHLSLHTQLLRAPSNQGRPRAPHQAQPATWQRTPSSSSATGAYSGGGYGSAPPCPYLRPGRYAPVDLGSPISLPVGRSSSGTGSLTAQLNVTFPSGAGKAPLVLLSAGFLLQSNMYKSYATDLASWGYTVCTYDLSELVPDIDHVAAMRNILDACCSDPRLAPYCNPACIVLAGHSRGGKLSVLTAGEDKRVRGLLLMDPVDNTAMTPQGPGYPSCLPALRNVISRASPPVPVLVLGAACNGDVIPAEGNYQRFSDAASRGVAWSFDLQGAGHVQFLDKSLGIFAAFSAPGPTSDSVVRQVTKAAMLAWLEAVVRPLALQGGVDTGAANRKLSAVAQALKGMAPASSALRGMELLEASGAVGSGRRDSETGASSSSGSSGASSAAGSGGRPGNFPPITDSYEQLLGRKASELKRMLMERNIPCSDCFEKADLAQRLLERCGSAAVAGRQ